MIGEFNPVSGGYEGEIQAEGQILFNVHSITDGFAAWFACFFILNMHYCKNIKKTLVFLDKKCAFPQLHP